MTKKLYLAFILVLLPLFVFASTAPVKSLTIPGTQKFYEIHTNKGVLLTGSQPQLSSLSHLKKHNIKTWVNLRNSKEGRQIPPTKISAENINYINIPIQINALTMKQIREFHNVISNKKNYPIYIHCASGNRAAMMLALNKIYYQQIPVAEAIKQAKQYGLTSKILQKYIKQFVISHH